MIKYTYALTLGLLWITDELSYSCLLFPYFATYFSKLHLLSTQAFSYLQSISMWYPVTYNI